MDTTTDSELMYPHEVATAFRVHTKTVAQWGAAGKLRSIQTPGGHRRYFAADVRALLRGDTPDGAR